MWLTLLAFAGTAFCPAATMPEPFRRMRFSPSPARTLAGIYQGHAPAADAAKRVFILRLAPDGTALLTTVYIGKDQVAQKGRWSQNGAELVLTFDPFGSNQPPRPIVFHYRREALHPVHWDLSEWGRGGPPVLYRDPGGKAPANL
jgi:NlpE N-terminal domain